MARQVTMAELIRAIAKSQDDSTTSFLEFQAQLGALKHQTKKTIDQQILEQLHDILQDLTLDDNKHPVETGVLPLPASAPASLENAGESMVTSHLTQGERDMIISVQEAESASMTPSKLQQGLRKWLGGNGGLSEQQLMDIMHSKHAGRFPHVAHGSG